MEKPVGQGYVVVRSDADYGVACRVAGNSTYRAALIRGERSWGGSDLRGKAQKWASRYAASRAALIQGLKEAQVPFEMRIVDRRKVLFIG